MSHPSYPSGARKRQNPFQNDYLEQSLVHHRVATYRQSNDRVNHYDTAPRRPSAETETRSHPHFINKNHHWQPSQSPPSPPQEKSPMTTLPSFSALSKIADGGVRNINHQEDREHKPRSPRKSNSLGSYHHHNTPPTPPLSSSSRSQSGSHPSPRTATTDNSRKRPPPVLTSKTIRAPTYHDGCQHLDTRPYLKLAPLMGSSEPPQLVSSPPATKRQCIRPPPQPVYSQQISRPNLSRPPEQLPATQLNSAYPVPPRSHAQPTSFYLTSPIGFEHHHYIAPSSVAYPLPQERYNCPDCGRAFSRPSSLKIHTYSHTGEKPFYCGVRGCNKNFSVRSNMKRHEKGCHARKK